jgi:hypothetical protein
MKIRPVLCFVMSASFASGLHAGEAIQPAASAANPLQDIGAGARPEALGSAFTAEGGDLSSLYFNPAGLGSLQGSHAGIHHHSWLGGINQETLGFGVGGSLASFGLSGDYVNYGQFDGVDASGNPTASYTATDMTLGVDVATQFRSGLSFGVRARGTQQSIAGAGQITTAGDAGAMWNMPGTKFNLGMMYSNFGPAVNGSGPSASLSFGFSYDMDLGPEYGLLILGSGSGLNSGGDLLQTGLELKLTRFLAVRAGYQVSFLDQGISGLAGLSAGLGFQWELFSLDYAYLPYGNLGNSNRISLNIDFFSGSPTPEKAPAGLQAQPKAPSPASPSQTTASQQPRPLAKGDSVDLVFEAPTETGPGALEAGLLAATKADPSNAKAWDDLGHYYFQSKEKAKMLQAFEQELALRPQNDKLRAWIQKVKGLE